MSGSCIPSASLAAMNARGYLQDINNTKHSGRMMIFTPAILGLREIKDLEEVSVEVKCNFRFSFNFFL